VDPIRINVWSDVACPWCYIGKRRLEAAVAVFTAAVDVPTVEVEFHSFELSPDTPVEFAGSAADFLAEHKGLPREQAVQMQAQVAAIAAQDGLHYDFASQKPANTRKAHQVLHLAKQAGLDVHVAMKERLLAAHFVEGRHIGRDDELADLAAEVGLDRDEVLAALAERRHDADVDADIARARQLGVDGVPFFVLDDRYGVSGAQPTELFTQALQQVVDDRAVAATGI
jgi:predicted DsbA family dithiol-disulfide isomerase